MSSQTDITAFALQDILEGIADGLSDAQRNLRDIAPYDSFGRPNTIYQVPYLEFSLQVTSEFQTVTDDNKKTRSVLKFQPAKLTSSNSAKTEIYSSVTGKFVATVPNEGLPQTIILVKTADPVLDTGVYKIEVEAEVKNSVGEKLPESTVEFNFDEETSLELNAGTAVALPSFEIAELSTDNDGIATTTVNIPAADFDAGKFYVININIGTVNKSVSLSKF
jgi:hypothetical protein